MEQAILSFIKKARNHLWRHKQLKAFIYSIWISLCVCLLLNIIGLVISIPYIPEKCLVILILGGLISFGYTFYHRPNMQKTALMVDQTGLNERLSTALMLIRKEDEMSILQRKDTLEHIKDYSIKTHFPFKWPIKQLIWCVSIFIICVVLFNLPTKAKQETDNIRAFDKQKQEISKQLDTQKKLLQEEKHLSEAEKAELMRVLNQTKKALNKISEQEKLENEVQRLSKKLERISKETQNKQAKQSVERAKHELTDKLNQAIKKKAESDLNKLTKVLEQNNETQKLAESLKDSLADEAAVKEQVEALMEQVSQLNEAQKAALSNTLANAAAQMQNSDLSQALQNASEGLQDGTFNSQNLAQQLSELKGMVQPNKVQNPSSTSSPSSESQGQSSGQGAGEGEGSGTGHGAGEGTGQASNQGSAQGQGQGNGNGGGWNMGSQQGNKQEGTPDKGELPAEGQEGQTTTLTGQIHNNEDIQTGEIPYGINVAGEKVDYRTVIGDYTDKAIETIEGESIPEEMKDTVKDYFEAINK